MNYGMGISVGYLLQPHQLLPSHYPFGRKTEYFCGCYDPKLYIILAVIFTKWIPIMEENRVVVGLFWPKIYVCMYGYKLMLYQSKVIDSSYARFTKPVIGIIDWFLLQYHEFLPSQFYLRGKMSNFEGFIVITPGVCGCRLLVYHSKVNTNSYLAMVTHEWHFGRYVPNAFGAVVVRLRSPWISQGSNPDKYSFNLSWNTSQLSFFLSRAPILFYLTINVR